MDGFWSLLAAEVLKTRRTALAWLIWLAPLTIVPSLLWYVPRATYPYQTLRRGVEIFFEGWDTLVIPFGAALAAVLCVIQEEQAGGFNSLLGAPRPRPVLYLGKLLLLCAFSSLSTLLAALGMGLGLVLGLQVDPMAALGVFLPAALLSLLGLLPLLAGYLWLGFASGKGASLALGSLGVFLAALIGATHLGDVIWPFVPWAWASRLAVAGLSLEPAASAPGELVFGGTLALFAFVSLSLGGMAWFDHWEGRMVYD